MKLSRMINVVGAHAEGEPNEVITGGVLNVPGSTMFEKARWLESEGDDLRAFLLHEPRGKVSQCTNLVLPSNHPEAQAGYIISEPASYPPMSGTNTICTATVLLETGMIPMVEPVTNVVLEAPGGLIRMRATCENGKVTSISFKNLPAFVLHRDEVIEVENHGSLRVDVAYGGMLYVIVDAADCGFAIEPDEAAELSSVGEKVKAAAAEQLPSVHPENPEIHTVNQTLWAGPLREENGVKTSRNGVIVSPGRLDRSPCGTGTTARLALLHARGDIQKDEDFVHESIIGTKFTGRIFEIGRTGEIPDVSVEITGRAWITAFHQYVLDPSDPFPTGYTLSDTWPVA
ncbi:proline racemase family protein [Leisingera thetidis]|uniref:proline racemase family protein n=1 Tax=Leisingera thetidis TaxID=2930199 RepID=UPI0021F6F5F1|nr:proline racemase family protein [Leisingera thetidis]